jgi:hypothetical protein
MSGIVNEYPVAASGFCFYYIIYSLWLNAASSNGTDQYDCSPDSTQYY